MEVLTAPSEMRAWSRHERSRGHRIATVPTMGALHDGHLALVAAADRLADRVVVTIFVNPLQFNQDADFDSYRGPSTRISTCVRRPTSTVYAPTAATMYPPGFQTHVEPGELAGRLEGPMRPGHFRGVATVVTKLLGATLPDVALFGEKDFQQLVIIRRMTCDLDLGVDIVGIPIQREPDGLAMSSRNVRLTTDDRSAAVVLSRALAAGDRAVGDGERDAAAVTALVTGLIEREPRASLEYVELVDADSLEPVERADPGSVLLTAAWFGDVRLIDNRVLGRG